jgi:hypothetical protein
MSDSTYSFVFDLQSAHAAFRGIGARELTLSLLAGLAPDPGWEGCRVELGESPLGPGTACVVTRGAAAGELQLRLVDSFERQQVRVIQVYEGGPEIGELLATALGSRWS